jgi:hypothetical protein
LEDDENQALNAGTMETTPIKIADFNESLRKLMTSLFERTLSNDGRVSYCKGRMYSLGLTFAGFARRHISKTFPQQKFTLLQYQIYRIIIYIL